jgi:hypothetical protein
MFDTGVYKLSFGTIYEEILYVSTKSKYNNDIILIG